MTMDKQHERCKYAYEEHVIKKRTLQSIATEENITRERVRQLIVRYKERYQYKERFESGDYKVVVLGDLSPLTTSKYRNFIHRFNLESYPVQSFVDNIDLRELVGVSNLGPRTAEKFIRLIEKAGYDVSHFWTPRDGKDYNTFEYVRKRPGRWNNTIRDRLPSLYAKSGAGSQGTSLPEI